VMVNTIEEVLSLDRAVSSKPEPSVIHEPVIQGHRTIAEKLRAAGWPLNSKNEAYVKLGNRQPPRRGTSSHELYCAAHRILSTMPGGRVEFGLLNDQLERDSVNFENPVKDPSANMGRLFTRDYIVFERRGESK